ncbi:MAG: histidine kinase [Chitinophagales bacterium]
MKTGKIYPFVPIRETHVVFAAYVIGFLFFTIMKVAIFYDFGWKWQTITTITSIFIIAFFSAVVVVIDRTLERYLPFEKNVWLRLVVQLLITLVFIISVRLVLMKPMMQLLQIHPSRDLILASFVINTFLVSTVILGLFVFRFVKRWRESELRQSQLEKEKAIVQYDNLKNQLNPHFLFNALTSLDSLIHDNPQLASQFLLQLSKVYRYVLENKSKTTVSLHTEIQFITHYVNLLKARFDKGLEVVWNLTPEQLEMKILPVTLQILIENAVKHNVTSAATPLQIEISVANDYLEVKNNLQRKKTVEHSNKQGLENLRNLYEVLVDRQILVEETLQQYIIRIPLLG